MDESLTFAEYVLSVSWATVQKTVGSFGYDFETAGVAVLCFGFGALLLFIRRISKYGWTTAVALPDGHLAKAKLFLATTLAGSIPLVLVFGVNVLRVTREREVDLLNNVRLTRTEIGEHATQLAAFIETGQEIRTYCARVQSASPSGDTQVSEEEAKKMAQSWDETVQRYIRLKLTADYAARYQIGPDGTGDSVEAILTPLQPTIDMLDARIKHLVEFMMEMRQPR
jgi:hypothetical protein